MSALRPKALSVLREGRLEIRHSACRRYGHVVDEVVARVASSRQGGPAYAVDFLDGVWTCTCRQETGCAHIAAVQLTTGHAPAELLRAGR